MNIISRINQPTLAGVKSEFGNSLIWDWSLTNVVDNLNFFQFLPVLMKLALDTCVPPVTKVELELVSHVLNKPGDKREGQVIVSYDRIYSTLKEAGVQHGCRVPPVFQSDGIDRRSSTYFNTNSEVIVTTLSRQHCKLNLNCSYLSLIYPISHPFVKPEIFTIWVRPS